jgi:hypothetical protein
MSHYDTLARNLQINPRGMKIAICKNQTKLLMYKKTLPQTEAGLNALCNLRPKRDKTLRRFRLKQINSVAFRVNVNVGAVVYE